MLQKKYLTGLALAALLSMPATASAQLLDYVALQYAQTTFDEGSVELEPTAWIGRFGRINTDYLALEARVGQSLERDSVRIGGQTAELEVEHLVGLYAIGRLPLTDWAHIYGVLGGTQIRLTADAGSGSSSNNEEDFSYGLGAQLEVGYGFSLHAEYMNYHDRDDYELSAVAVGLGYRF